MSTLIIDNYDSFTYNLYHLLRDATPNNEIIHIVSNDKLTSSLLLSHDHIIASPGAGIPSEAGQLLETLNIIEGKRPFLGVCLGHQALAEYYNAKLFQLPHPIHGCSEKIKIDNSSTLFYGLDNNICVARYHSWAVCHNSLPECLQVTAYTNDGTIMALQHNKHLLFGLQFHPESFMTPKGIQIIKNFYRI